MQGINKQYVDRDAESEALAWLGNSVGSWYLRDDQLDFYEFLKREKNPFLEASRRYGKTTDILCHVIEELLSHPGWIARWCEPQKNQAIEIVQPEINKIQLNAPQSKKFVYSTVGGYYEAPNGSRLFLRGINEDKGESARGTAANIIVADEFGFWRNAGYVRSDVLDPQLLTTNGQFIIASTPPPNLGHVYYKLKSEAVNKNKFMQKTIYDNKGLTQVQIDEACEKAGGKESATWRREYLCEPVADPERLIIPEFKEEIHIVSDDYPSPQHFDAYVGMDLGLDDWTFALFAHYDFLKAELVIDDEWCDNNKNTKTIVEECRKKEFTTWGTKPCRCGVENHPQGPRICKTHGLQPYMRVGDNEMQQLFDMHTEHGYYVNATDKDDKHAAINAVRLRFGSCKVRIKRRCVNLLFQLKVGIWNTKKTEFERGENIGHLDGIDALVYLNRNVSVTHNPFPQVIINPERHFIPNAEPSANEQKLVAIFGG